MILVSFSAEVLVFTVDSEEKTVSFPYREHPEVFGHPRFLMLDLKQSDAIVRLALKELMPRRALIAAKIEVSISRSLQGGITDMDRRIIEDIFLHAGARKVVFRKM